MGVPPIDPYHAGIAAAYLGKRAYGYWASSGKMPRVGPMTLKRKRSRGDLPGVFDGKFRGRIDRSKNRVLRSGYSETHVQSGSTTLDGCCYVGMASYSAFRSGSADGAADYGRVFQDIWIAILRKWFRHYHPGRVEFFSPDQNFDQMFDSDDGNTYDEKIQIKYSKPDGTNTSPGSNFTYLSSKASSPASYTNLRALANAIADQVMTQWKTEGRVPIAMYCVKFYTVVDEVAPIADQYISLKDSYMNLSQCIVRANMVSTMAVQNQTIATDTGEGAGFRNSMLDISCNPVRGKLFYFRGLGPIFNSGYDLGNDADNTTTTGDEWGARFLSKPSSGITELMNIYSPVNDPTGCWQIVPNRQYFRNCIRAVNVTLNPGHIKTFKISFRFKGSLWNFIKAEQVVLDNTSVYENGDVETELKSAGSAKNMGSSVILALEKRIRGGTEGVQLQWQCTSHISTDCYIGSKQVMTKDVFISATEDPVV